MQLFTLETSGLGNRYALISRAQEILLLDFHALTLEEDLDRVLEHLPEPRSVAILQTRRAPALGAARERLQLLLPEAVALGPDDDISALEPLRINGDLLQILPLGNGHWGYRMREFLFLGAVRDALGRWRGDAAGRSLLAQAEPGRRRLWAFPAAAEGIVDLAAVRAGLAA
ncbi:MAG: hypothetical protein U7M05_04745 [Candidatus Igneacidithiobacillus chanchocoensis]